MLRDKERQLNDPGVVALDLRVFGALPDRIGIGIYVIYPALFSDVTAAWRLSRGQRVLVDLGGSYFQLLVTVALLAAERVTHAPLLRFTCWASLASPQPSPA